MEGRDEPVFEISNLDAEIIGLLSKIGSLVS